VRSLPLLRQRGCRRLLFAGNGISLEPHAFAHAGFEVIALDVAPAACAFVEKVPMDRDLLASFFKVRVPAGREGAGSVDKDASLKQVDEEYRPGGQLTVVVGDMFAWAPDAPLDAIFNIKSFQGFPPEDQRTLAIRFYGWLAPGGICLVQTQNVQGSERDLLEGAFVQAGFFLHGEKERAAWRTHNALPQEARDRERFRQEIAAAAAADQAGEARRLDAGEKMVVFIHGSG
jgi:hypothetical protein